MLMTGTKETAIKHDHHLFHLHQFLEQIELNEYYTLIVEKLKVRERKGRKNEMNRENEGRLKSINSSSFHFFDQQKNRSVSIKSKETSEPQNFSTTMSKWIKNKDDTNHTHSMRKVIEYK